MEVTTQAKNKGGRPFKYTVEQVTESIDKYIKDRRAKQLPISQAGYALEIGVDEDTITNWKDKEGYSEQVKKLTLASKAFTIDCLFTMKNPAGAIFYGKNFHDMADKIENTNNINITASLPSGAEYDAMIDRLIAHRQARQLTADSTKAIDSAPIDAQFDVVENKS